MCLLQVIKHHKLGLNSIWDVPWRRSSSSISNGKGYSNGSSNGTERLAASLSNGSSGSNGAHPPAAAAADDDASQPAQEGCEFTTWKFRSTGVAKRTIDYIWYSKQQLTPISRWRMLSEAEIGPEGLPSRQYPSDHMCVACQFGWLE